MTKQEVIKRIQELASERGDHVSFDVFLQETGLKDKWLRGQEWYSGWNTLLSEIGLETRVFRKPATPLTAVTEPVAALAERLGRWPADDDVRRERKRNSSFPSLKIVSRFRRNGALARSIVDLCEQSGRFAAALPIAKAHITADPDEGIGSSNEQVKGYVYMYRSGRRYKIGRSNNPSRRYREVRLDLPDETHAVHSIQTDDPAGIEAYWHARFAAKRVRNTEFFALDATDVQAFKRRRYQ